MNREIAFRVFASRAALLEGTMKVGYEYGNQKLEHKSGHLPVVNETCDVALPCCVHVDAHGYTAGWQDLSNHLQECGPMKI